MEGGDRDRELFTVLASFVEDRLGLRYSFEDRSLLFDKLEARVLEVAHGSFLQYYYRLRYDDPKGEELAALSAALAVGETYLFREPAALFLLADDIIPRVIDERGRARVWCAASSTGEEVYSLALLLADRGLLDKVSIVGTDLSRRFLTSARRGSVALRSLERSPRKDIVAPHVEVRDGRVWFPPGIVSHVDFHELNLVDTAAVRAEPVADAILLRNVLIYFGPDTVRRVVSALTERLSDDGVLIVGVSESLLRVDLPLACQERGGVFFYTKVPS